MHGPVIAQEEAGFTSRKHGGCLHSDPLTLPPSISSNGLYVTYEQEPSQTYHQGRQTKTLELWQAVVKLDVQISLAGSSFSTFHPVAISFKVDTGAHITLIPKHLVPAIDDISLYRQPTILLYGIEGQGIMVALLEAHLAMRPPVGSSCEAVQFQPILIGIPFEPLKQAILGLDVLRQVMMVSDPEHITVWPLR